MDRLAVDLLWIEANAWTAHQLKFLHIVVVLVNGWVTLVVRVHHDWVSVLLEASHILRHNFHCAIGLTPNAILHNFVIIGTIGSNLQVGLIVSALLAI